MPNKPMKKKRKIAIENDLPISTLAKNFNTTVETIKGLNPNLETYTNRWSLDLEESEEMICQSQFVLLPSFSPDEFTPAARYRCNQDNIILIDGQPHFSCETKTQYVLSQNENFPYSLCINIEDYINSIHPKELKDCFDSIREIELLRTGVILSFRKEKQQWEIENIDELHNRWTCFLDKEMGRIPFFEELKNRNAEAVSDFITKGNREFSDPIEFLDVLDKNYFYHLLFISKQNDNDRNNSHIVFHSQIFPDVKCPIIVSAKKENSDKEKKTKIILTGELDRTSIDKEKLRKLYAEIYQPLIQYSFSEYNFIYTVECELDNTTGLICNAHVYTEEMVKNNYQIISQFELRRVDL